MDSNLRTPLLHAITVDVEEYFHTEAASSAIAFDHWSTLPSRVQASTDTLLELFAAHGVKGTFFVLGWVAERHPALLRTIANAGHELACHSYRHRAVFRLSAHEFAEDTHRAKSAIEDASGKRVIGYRAPSFSITPGTEWAFDELAELGFLYDSSVHPIAHDFYSNTAASRDPHRLRNGLLEIPISTARVFGKNLPIAGGGYLRMLPFWYSKWGLTLRMRQAPHIPIVLYMHPWEIDPEQPRLALSGRSRFRQYTNLRSMRTKIERLMQSMRFTSVEESFRRWIYPSPSA